MLMGFGRMMTKVLRHPANKGRRASQLGVAVRFQIRSRLWHEPTVVRLGQRSRLLATQDSSASILAAYAPQPDFEEWQAWKQILRPGDLFVDVGANIGVYTVLACEIGARVIAAEPDPDNVSRLRQNLLLNQYEAEIWQVALTNESEDLQLSAGLDSMNRLLTSGEGQRVRGERFDTLIEDRPVRGMKVDVEGAERLVVEGASDALLHGRIDVLQLEWNECARLNYDESRLQLESTLLQYGYELFRPDAQGNLTATDGREGRDVFAVRHGAAGIPVKWSQQGVDGQD